MKAIHLALAHLLDVVFDHAVIGKNDPEGPYLMRWFLPRGRYLHLILRSDSDKALHDHPWTFTSILLWGSYVEVEHEGSGHGGAVRRRRIRWINRRPDPAIPHRLELSSPVWSLVTLGPRVRIWGFWPVLEGVPRFVDSSTFLGRPAKGISDLSEPVSLAGWKLWGRA